MKKKNVIAGFLAALLLAQGTAVPVWATEQESTAVESTATEPTETTEFVIPEYVDGDAHIAMGSSTLDAGSAVIDAEAYQPSGKAELVYDLNSDTMLYAWQIDERVYPASTTKIMTCLVALELCDLTDTVTVTTEAIKEIDWTSSASGFVAGEELTIEQLLYCLMVKSANDAGCVIAEHLCGSQAAFVEKMNEKALELGCTGTHFVNVHGLHDDDHYTTARDMAKIMKAALESELFRTLFSTVKYTVPATNKSDIRELSTTNLLMDPDSKLYDSRVIGGKTGFTTPAGRCLVSVSESGDMKLITVVMGAKWEYYSDGWNVRRYGNFADTVELMDLAYGSYRPAQILSPYQVLEQFDVDGGECAVQAYVTDEVSVIVPNEAVLADFTYQTVLDGALTAPIARDEKLGTVRVWYRGQCVAQAELYALSDVKKQESAPQVQEPSAVKNQTGVMKLVAGAILAVAGLFVLLVLVGKIRNAMYLARKKRQRKARQKNRVRSK